MPELPEVETIRQDLRKKVLNKKIVQVKVVKSKLSSSSVKEFERALLENTFTEINRIGKLLIFHLKKSKLFLLVHLKMTGQLIYIKNKKIVAGGHSFPALNTHLPDKHTQIIFKFTDVGVLYFNDMRRFGYAKLVDEKTKEAILGTYGFEPLGARFTLEHFSDLLKKRKMVLKALLLSQNLIAGIGNIYADEICHVAGVLPWRRTNTLTKDEIEKLFKSTIGILKKAIKYRGTTFNNYVDSSGNKGNFVSFLKVYERAGKKCLTCKKSVIHKKRVAGRGTHYCPVCQK